MNAIKNLSIDPTYLCNERCISCSCEKISHYITETLSLTDYKNVISEFAILGGENVFVFGGEPLLCELVFDILKLAKDKKLNTSITTNGTLISNETICSKLIDTKVDQIIISIMDIEENYELLHGKQLFSSLTKGINSLLTRLNEKDCNVSIHVTLQNMNYRSLPDIVKFAKNVGINKISCQYVSTVPDKTYKETEKLLNIELDKNLSHWTQNQNLFIQPGNIAECIDSIFSAKEFADNSGIELVLDPVFFQNNAKEILISGAHEPKGICELNDIVILPNGKVGCCSMMQHYLIGDIKGQSLKDIVNSEAFHSVKRKVERGSFLPVCRYCCKHAMYYS